MNVVFSVFTTLSTALCYLFYHWAMLVFFDMILRQRTTPFVRILTGLINYLVFLAISLLGFYLIINWTIFAVLLVVESVLLYRQELRLSLCLGIQGVLIGLAVNLICRSCTALALGVALSAVDSVNSFTYLKFYPILLSFLVSGLLFIFLRRRFADWELPPQKQERPFIGFFLVMSLTFFLYLDLNLLIYFTEGSEWIVKAWGIKSGLFVLIGDFLCYSHIYTLAKYVVYKNKSRALHESVQRVVTLSKELEQTAYRDALTGCLSREAAAKALRELNETQKPYRLCFLDLDGLKEVNDRMGHSWGDKYLSVAAQEMQQAAGEQGSVYRFGGDEFLLLAPGLSQEEFAALLGQFLSALDRHSHTSEYPFKFAVSYGMAASGEADDPSKVLALADRRMYEQKAQHKKEPRQPAT